MLPSERVRELEIEIHNKQPHLDRVVVCLRAITAYLDETQAAHNECSECKHPEGFKNSHYPTCPILSPAKRAELPPIVFPALPLKPEPK